MRSALYLMALCAVCFALPAHVAAGSASAEDERWSVGVERALVIEPAGRAGRSPVFTDAIEAERVGGRWSRPREGESVTSPDGEVLRWTVAEAGDDGWIAHRALRGGYAYVVVHSDRARAAVLHAVGHSFVIVNGEPRTGDVYRTGYVRLPVRLREGENHFLFRCARGRFRAELTEVGEGCAGGVLFNTGDPTLADLMVGEMGEVLGAVVLVNARGEALAGATIEAALDGGEPVRSEAALVEAYSVRKVGFAFGPVGSAQPGTVDLSLVLRGADGEVLDEATVGVRVRRADQSHKRTFVSEIDGSVQYYAVQPARRPEADPGGPALYLSLHGASVEATSQARAYAPRQRGHIVAPTNRRPFGFDWEDWGRADAVEVLEHASRLLGADRSRVYLTGHSMGGHGVWHVGATFPDRFAAIGPSAGWISFWSYTGAEGFEGESPVERVLRRATTGSDTLALSRNFLHHGVYILHGDADDNVPVGQARTMLEHLSAFHPDVHYHEQPGAGHWWNASDEPGTDCVDWDPMFDLFASRRIPAPDELRRVEFVTANPGVSSRCHWVEIEAQRVHMEPSSVGVSVAPVRRRFEGTTDNVERVVLDASVLVGDGGVAVVLDGHRLEDLPPDGEGLVRLERVGAEWRPAGAVDPGMKGPHRYGAFKHAFDNRFVLVYGTAGTEEENAWAFAKARYDAETFWYRGNGAADVVADADFDPGADADRNVILYGCADSNGAWSALLGGAPIRVERSAARIGDRVLRGDDLACLFIYPRAGSDAASVGVVAGTGLAGKRLTDRLPYFVSGVAYPDWVVLGTDALERGLGGVRGAGFFSSAWEVDPGQSAWRDREAGAGVR